MQSSLTSALYHVLSCERLKTQILLRSTEAVFSVCSQETIISSWKLRLTLYMERSIRRELCSWSRSFTKRSFCWEKEGETSVKQWGRQTWMSSVCVSLLNILYTEFESRERRDVEIKQRCVSQKCQKGDVLFSMHVQNTNWAAWIYLQVGKRVWHFLVLYDLCWIEENLDTKIDWHLYHI